MAETFDSAARLAEGLPPVATVQAYVQACQMLGYQHPDLTAHVAQVRDWYASEDGLDLRALDSDCAALHAAAAAAEEALVRQHDQLGLVATAWQGRAADASREFLRHHGEASAAAASAVRTAANALSDLRDSLWHTVDGKVATVLAIDDRVQAQRADWLAAAQTVTTGAGDRAAASELVDQQVKPFVDNVIGGEWVSAMRGAIDAIESAYDAAAAELTSEADALFDVPGDLGPSWEPSSEPSVATSPPGEAAVTPAAAMAAPTPAAGAPTTWPAPPALQPMPSPFAPPPAPPVDPAAMAPAAPAPAPPSLPSAPSLGGGLPDIGSGLSGFGQQLGETVGGLLGGADNLLPEPGDIEPGDIDPDEVDEPDEDVADEVDGLDGEDDGSDEVAAEEAGAEDNLEADSAVEGAADVACEPEEPAPQPVEAVVEEPVPAMAPVPPPEPLSSPSPSAAATPCEIAADELPQVGE